MNSQSSRLPVILTAVAVLAAIGYFGWRYYSAAQAPTVVSPPIATAPVAPPPVAVASAPMPPAILNPVEAITTTATVSPTPLPALADSDKHVNALLADLLSRKNILTFLQVDGWVRRVVATVDNLARDHAPPKVWPVVPTPERFMTLKGPNGVETIHLDNSQRYTPLVLLIESVDAAKAVALYRSLYPLFQQAYEELGFPGRYFNDRLVAVLDHLIATPVQTAPLIVTLVEVKGPVPSLRPWVRYEYASPAFEALSAGQKILLRTGPVNHRRLKAKLQAIRALVAKAP